MFTLSERCARLRDEAENFKELSRRICFQREYHFTRGCVEAGDAPNEIIVASGQAAVIRGSRPIIQDGELIVGWNYGDGELGEQWKPVPGNAADYAVMAENGFGGDEIDWYYMHKPEADKHMRPPPPLPESGERERLLEGERAILARCVTANHTVLGYEQVLRLGFAGLAEKADGYAAQNGDSPFYRGVKTVLDAACGLGDKYAEEAERLAAAERRPARAAELAQIAESCRRVPRNPAESFRDAVQSLWFAHIINTWEDYINANSLGRLDQILYPYYRRDIERGAITPEEAFELICCLWIKLYRDYDVQQSCVGGCLADGSPAVNDLSRMMLDATEALGFVRCLSVRFSPEAGADRAFVRRALQVAGNMGKGVPFFFNDGVMIPALTAAGIPLEDARGYTQIGCVETVIPGKSNPHAVSGEINLLKAMEYALGNGESMLNPGTFPGLATGDPQRWESYADARDAAFTQMDFMLDTCCRQVAERYIPGRWDIKPFKSALTEGCVESGTDYNSRGALYDYYQIMLEGIPNLADSLAAVKKLVFEDRRYDMAQLLAALRADFPDEAVRLDFINKAPKYGNDIAEVDEIAAEIMDFACDRLARLSEKYGHAFHAQPFTFLWMLPAGKLTAATPDGRRAGETLAYSVSPMQGRDYNGLTALLNSISGLPTKKAPATASAIVEVDPVLFSEENLDQLTDIFLGAAERGLANVQWNCVGAETLMEAQKYPDKYKNLAVRVSGFSQKFNLLDKDLQDHIIARTKHARV